MYFSGPVSIQSASVRSINGVPVERLLRKALATTGGQNITGQYRLSAVVTETAPQRWTGRGFVVGLRSLLKCERCAPLVTECRFGFLLSCHLFNSANLPHNVIVFSQ